LSCRPFPKCGICRRYLSSPLTEKVLPPSYYERSAIRRLGHKGDALHIYVQLAGHMLCQDFLRERAN
jgi:predicted glycosyltransferase